MEAEVAAYDIGLIEPPQTILDIGANIGAYSLRCASRWPNASITAYEPVKKSVNELVFNTKDIPTIHVIGSAVRSFVGDSSITVGAMSVTSSFHASERDSEGIELVHCVDGKSIPSAELVKIDTEGCEIEILNSLDLSKTKAIVCEWHSKSDREEIIRIVTGAGFEKLNEVQYVDAGSSGVLRFARPNTTHEEKPVKLFIGIPVYQQMATQFNHCLLALQHDKKFHIELHTGQGDGVARTRNNLTADFMKTDCTHLLFIDCDLIFSSEHIARIVSHSEDVVGGFYAKKQEGPLEWVINTFPGPVEKRTDGLHKVAYIGTGFICIRRNVIERMIERYPHIAFAADYGTREIMHDIWPMTVYCAECGDSAGESCTHAPHSRRYLSEDWFFCQRWMDMGGEVFGDTGVVLKHVGPAIFPLITQLPEITNPKKPEVKVKETALTDERA
jgi:FkbM family methyltransferase